MPLVAVVALLLAAGLVLAVVLLLKYRGAAGRSSAELDTLKDKYAADTKRLTDRTATLETENQRLARWSVVADADEKATELLRDAQSILEKARADAAAVLAEAQQKAATLASEVAAATSKTDAEAKEEAKKLKEETKALLDAATVRAKAIIDEADNRARAIAGSAYDAMNKAELYEQTVKAMKNLIDGYGDQYIVPSQSLLDDLAEEFGYTEAGQQLKVSRERSAAMVKNGTAATCDYVEPYRRQTAIEFVVDAFNGKVDSILSRVKNDNAGTLQQQIRDAFTLVNHNGSAFRSARITEEYLQARLDELKWAAVAQQLKLEEREEQRRIKEQIREEEKARREYERAMRDAAKEEDLIRKAMEKAQERLATASAEQKMQYEQQLGDLRARLAEAEAKNQRALSMAQQTRRGHVYIISNIGSFGDDVYKIGLTRRLEPLDRVRELGDSSVPFEFDVHAMIFSEDAPALETRLHKHFVSMQLNKVNFRKEFFRVDLQHVKQAIETLGVAAKWTMAAQAREYRETLALEKAMSEDPKLREQWVKRQLELEPVQRDFISQASGVTDESTST